MIEMTDERASEVLAAHNEWRRYDGLPGEPGAPAMGDPAELGRAIDHVVSRLRSQPTAEAQAVAWVAADTLNTPHPTCISSLAYMSQIDKDRGREYVPLYAAPVAAQKAGDAQDAERYRWLRKGESDDVAVVRGLGAMDYGMSVVAYTYSEEIDGDDLDSAIDAVIAKATVAAP